jgi:hypothetical protein
MITDVIYNTYTNLYNGITDEMWESFAEKYNTTTDILHEVFRLKENEYELLTEQVQDWYNAYPLMKDILEKVDQDVLYDMNVEQIFLSAMDKLINAEGLETIRQDKLPWSCVLGETIMMAFYEIILDKISFN